MATPSPFGDEHVAAVISGSGERIGGEGQHTPVTRMEGPSARATPVRTDTIASASSFGHGNDPPPEYKAQSAAGPQT